MSSMPGFANFMKIYVAQSTIFKSLRSKLYGSGVQSDGSNRHGGGIGKVHVHEVFHEHGRSQGKPMDDFSTALEGLGDYHQLKELGHPPTSPDWVAVRSTVSAEGSGAGGSPPTMMHKQAQPTSGAGRDGIVRTVDVYQQNHPSDIV